MLTTVILTACSVFRLISPVSLNSCFLSHSHSLNVYLSHLFKSISIYLII